MDRLRPPQTLFELSNHEKRLSRLWIVQSGTFLTFWNLIVLLEEPQTKSFDLWTPSTWHGLCIAFDRTAMHLSLVKDGKITNVDSQVAESGLQGMDFSMLEAFSPLLWGKSGGSVTDVNLWDRALTIDEMKNWTFCQ